MKSYADQKHKAKESKLKEGDVVLVKTPKENKLSTPFSAKPYVITSKNGTQITAENNSHTITRNSSYFKKVDADLEIVDQEFEDQEEEDSNIPTCDISSEKQDALAANQPVSVSNQRPSRVII